MLYREVVFAARRGSMTDEPAWPFEKLSALRLGRRLAVEVPATDPGRRAFVDITPREVDRDAEPRREGWTHRNTARSIKRLSTGSTTQTCSTDSTNDIGSILLRSASAANESELLTVLRKWQLGPHQFQYAWDTADPR
ncbi:hypothetical protein GCM10027186_59930 [Micromonospora schwarzwaldensis]